MELIDKSGTRQICGYCHRAKRSGEFARPRAKLNKQWVCADCSTGVLESILDRYYLQVESGMPFSERYTEIPTDFVPFIGDRWMEELRLAVIDVDSSRLSLVGA